MISNCEQCGASPAQLVTSRWHLGLIIYGRTMGKQAVLCRAHARSMVAGDLAKTLLLGWWGVYSFFINLIVLPVQIAELTKAGRIEQPAAESPAAMSVASSGNGGGI
jgi:hypothetical protein